MLLCAAPIQISTVDDGYNNIPGLWECLCDTLAHGVPSFVTISGWQRRSRHNRQSLVETAVVYRYKTIIVQRLQARTLPKQQTGAKIGYNVLNR